MNHLYEKHSLCRMGGISKEENLEEWNYYSLQSPGDSHYLYMKVHGVESLVPFSKMDNTGVLDERGILDEGELKEKIQHFRTSDGYIWYGFFDVNEGYDEYFETPKDVIWFLNNRFFPHLERNGILRDNLHILVSLHKNTPHRHIHFLFCEKERTYFQKNRLQMRDKPGLSALSFERLYREVEGDLTYIKGNKRITLDHMHFYLLPKSEEEQKQVHLQKTKEYLEEYANHLTKEYERYGYGIPYDKSLAYKTYTKILKEHEDAKKEHVKIQDAYLKAGDLIGLKAFQDGCGEYLYSYAMTYSQTGIDLSASGYDRISARSKRRLVDTTRDKMAYHLYTSLRENEKELLLKTKEREREIEYENEYNKIQKS